VRSFHTAGDMYGFHELSLNTADVSWYITINCGKCSYCPWYVRISWTVSRFCRCLSIYYNKLWEVFVLSVICTDFMKSVDSADVFRYKLWEVFILSVICTDFLKSVDSADVSRYTTTNCENCSYCPWYVYLRISWTVSKFGRCLSIYMVHSSSKVS
jgi:predicted nucleic-acid-binding Zn-ribbon protein